MSKLVILEPIGVESAVATNANLLTALNNENIQMVQGCGGRGLCATCHVFVREGMDNLSPLSSREKRTLGVVTSCNAESRLACQALIQGDGVVVQVPSGLYVTESTNFESMIGQRAEEDILHPVSGEILVEKRKLITRSMISQLGNVRDKFTDYLNQASNI
ncbi:2Fe-2S iron-sulfur cluster-binding protein [Lyngbya confervoides]|uniref:(2Fe-2S)-binding protein n=1 Tax=Lyngbya confervoides BDU141951 TaxID=1574623 RepID=A0ABD4T563_9CYAN|nr:2Fe-2S iron-sulfur cluster-binding protein [Lyngbya confervoides]MCM1983823.1 (2Fe-2S)-binding protein [Lyngbya confervoides BDU141951]